MYLVHTVNTADVKPTLVFPVTLLAQNTHILAVSFLKMKNSDMQYILHCQTLGERVKVRPQTHIYTPFLASVPLAGWWSLCDVHHPPGTSPPACCRLWPCWCTSRWRGQRPACWRSSRCFACRREIGPSRCPSWSVTNCLCPPLAVVRKDEDQNVWLTKTCTHIKRLMNL